MRKLIAAVAGVVCLAAGSANAADWQVKAESSLLDGQSQVVATLESDNQVPNSIGRLETATLIVRCSERRLEVFVSWPGFVGIDSTNAAYRLDEGQIQSSYLSTSTSGTATFFAGRAVRPLLASLASSKRFVLKITPNRYASQEAVWTLGDAAAPIQQAIQACP